MMERVSVKRKYFRVKIMYTITSLVKKATIKGDNI